MSTIFTVDQQQPRYRYKIESRDSGGRVVSVHGQTDNWAVALSVQAQLTEENPSLKHWIVPEQITKYTTIGEILESQFN